MDPIPPEAFLASYPPPIRDAAERLRGILIDAVPDVIERVRPGWRLIGYDVPLGRRSKYFAWVMPEGVHVHLGFVNGVLMADPDGVMHGAGITKSARWLTYRRPDDVDAELVVPLVHEAVRVATLSRGERQLLAAGDVERR